jgi:RNA 3'-terminal phosphate cyclase
MKKYPSLKPGIWGAVIGAIGISVIGFSSLGWTLGSTAERIAKERAQTAVVEVLSPICVEKFRHQADAASKLVEFAKVSGSWDRRAIIEKGGWATVAGSDAPNPAVVSACAEQLGGRL